VVLDSLRRLLPGIEENDSGSMAEALGLCKLLAQRARTAVIVIHHSKKATSEGETYRGSSAIADQASIVYRLSREKGDIDRFRRVLVNEKMRVAAEPPPKYLRIGVDGGIVALGAASAPGDGEVASGSASAEMAPQVLELLEKRPRTRAKVAKALGRDKSDGTVRRVFEQLKKADRIEPDDNGVWRAVAISNPHSASNGNPVAKDVATGNTRRVADDQVAGASADPQDPDHRHRRPAPVGQVEEPGGQGGSVGIP